MKKVLKNNKTEITITFAILLLSLFFCNSFVMEKNLKSIFLYFYLRTTFTLNIFIIVKKILDFTKKIKNKKKEAIQILKYFIIIFILLLLIGLTIWPGAWCWDEFFILEDAVHVKFSTWQNYLTIIFYSHCLMLFWRAETIIIVQILFISYVISHIMLQLEKILNNKKRIWLLLLPLFLPAIIINNFYPLRLTMYAYIELYFLFEIFMIYKKNLKLNFFKSFELSIIIFILAIWRTEGIYYFSFYIILFFMLKEKKQKMYLFLSLAIISVLYSPVEIYIKKEDKETQYRYKTTAIINPLSMMLQTDLKNSDNSLEEINKVLNIEAIIRNASYVETPSYWNGTALQENFMENFSSLYKGYFQLVLSNPSIFMKARWKTFLSTNGLDEFKSTYINDFVSRKVDNNVWYNQLEKSVINKRGRNKVIGLLTNQNRLFKTCCWNCIPFIFLIFYLIIFKFIKHEWFEMTLLCFIIARVPLVYLTASANYFMYYFPTYLIGSYLVVFIILKKIDEKSKWNKKIP